MVRIPCGACCRWFYSQSSAMQDCRRGVEVLSWDENRSCLAASEVLVEEEDRLAGYVLRFRRGASYRLVCSQSFVI
jgi:hypothetical protein